MQKLIFELMLYYTKYCINRNLRQLESDTQTLYTHLYHNEQTNRQIYFPNSFNIDTLL